MIKIDIDSKAGVWDCLERVIFFNSLDTYHAGIYFEKLVETRKGWHVVLGFESGESISSFSAIFYQLLFGSDWKREMLNYQRVRNGVSRWNILFASSEHGENYADLFNEYLKMKVLS